ncbi:glycosyltransferase family 4 protein [bacterium]|nr:glycosyltransferase family 4 protein [bacterium]
MSVIVSCSTKFHAFNLVEQLNRHDMLTSFYTMYASQKNTWFKNFTRRVDKENIPINKIKTKISLAILKKLISNSYLWNDEFDKWVAKEIKRNNNYNTFIGWSGMSLNAIKQVKKDNNTAILERGSSHILFQNEILKEEYGKFGINFQIDQRTIDKELEEYELADYITCSSGFVKGTFVEKGISEEKLFVNNYGRSNHFQPISEIKQVNNRPFRVLYLGSLLIRKGLIYFFEALKQLNIPKENIEIWFIGSIEDSLKSTIQKYKQENWKFHGHINHYELNKYISECDVAVHPSIEEGLSMVIPQMLSCGVPVIATTNTGGEDVIEEGENGFIVPIRSPIAIAKKIELLYNNPKRLKAIKQNTINKKSNLSWEYYGNRYYTFLKSLN